MYLDDTNLKFSYFSPKTSMIKLWLVTVRSKKKSTESPYLSRTLCTAYVCTYLWPRIHTYVLKRKLEHQFVRSVSRQDLCCGISSLRSSNHSAERLWQNIEHILHCILWFLIRRSPLFVSRIHSSPFESAWGVKNLENEHLFRPSHIIYLLAIKSMSWFSIDFSDCEACIVETSNQNFRFQTYLEQST